MCFFLSAARIMNNHTYFFYFSGGRRQLLSSPVPCLGPTWIEDEMSIISPQPLFSPPPTPFAAVLVLSCCLLFCSSGSLERWSHPHLAPRLPLPKQRCIYLTENSHLSLEKPESRQTEIGQEFPRKPVWAGGDACDWQQPLGGRTKGCIYGRELVVRGRFNKSYYYSGEGYTCGLQHKLDNRTMPAAETCYLKADVLDWH